MSKKNSKAKNKKKHQGLLAQEAKEGERLAKKKEKRVAVGVKKKVGKYERRKIFKLKKNRDGTPMFSGMEAEDSD